MPESQPEAMSLPRLTMIVETLCIGGKGHPMTGGDGAIVDAITNALVWDARAAIHTVYSTHRSSVRWAVRS